MSLALFTSSLARTLNVSPPPVERPAFLTVASDESYSWWCEHTTAIDNGNTYFCSIALDGSHKLTRIDTQGNVTSCTLHTGMAVDEHNTAAILVRENDILCAYTGHNVSELYVRLVSKDLQTMGAEKNIRIETGLYATSYVQLFEQGGRYFIYTRRDRDFWGVAWSDNATNWQGKVMWKKDDSQVVGKMYMSVSPTPQGIFNMAIYTHPVESGTANRLYVAQFNPATGEVSTGGVSLGNFYSSDWAAYWTTDLPVVHAPKAGHLMRLLDVAGDAQTMHVLMADYDQGNYDLGSYYYLKIDTQTRQVVQQIQLPDHGKDTYTSYIGGAYFLQDRLGRWNGEISLAREEAGRWYLELYKYDGASFVKTHDIDSIDGADGTSLTRPLPIIGAKSGEWELLYQVNKYFGTYTNWQGVLKVWRRSGSSGGGSDPSTLLFSDNLEGSTALDGWNIQNGGTAYAIQHLAGPTGGKALRFELRAGDPPNNSGTRTEVYYPQRLEEAWYSFKVYFPSSEYADETGNSRESICQFHQGGGSGSPYNMLLVEKGVFRLFLDNEAGRNLRLDLGPQGKDQWHTFVFYTKFSQFAEGHVKCWLNGSLVADETGPNLAAGFSLPELKLGIYKWDWNNGGTTTTDKRVLWLDDVKVGNKDATYAQMSGTI